MQVQVKPRMRAGSWAQFEARYAPIDGPDGTPVRTHAEIGDAPERCVWTVVDCDGVLYVLPGFHTVNYMGRIVTEREWSDADGQRYWTVTLVRTVTEVAFVTVTAASDDEARTKALEIDEDRLDFSAAEYGEAEINHIEQH